MLLQESVCFDHELPGTSGQRLVVCTGSQKHGMLVFSSSGSLDRLQVANISAFPVKSVSLQQNRPACSCTYSSAAISVNGSYLAAVCGPAQPYVEYWQLSPLQLLHSADLLPGHYGMQSLTGRMLTRRPFQANTVAHNCRS